MKAELFNTPEEEKSHINGGKGTSNIYFGYI